MELVEVQTEVQEVLAEAAIAQVQADIAVVEARAETAVAQAVAETAIAEATAEQATEIVAANLPAKEEIWREEIQSLKLTLSQMLENQGQQLNQLSTEQAALVQRMALQEASLLALIPPNPANPPVAPSAPASVPSAEPAAAVPAPESRPLPKGNKEKKRIRKI
jgi:hypothetical protein